jgi:2-polyprenyl-3-methyl-5-hydroxy-6-metoxy-1,4-benzoquinol methylase
MAACLRRNCRNEICGVDGNHINPKDLLIPQKSFVSLDLRQPFDIPGRYDLVICLEVAEHLSPESGRYLVRALSQAAPLVFFSAAVPGQGGSYHVNEQ